MPVVDVGGVVLEVAGVLAPRPVAPLPEHLLDLLKLLHLDAGDIQHYIMGGGVTLALAGQGDTR